LTKPRNTSSVSEFSALDVFGEVPWARCQIISHVNYFCTAQQVQGRAASLHSVPPLSPILLIHPIPSNQAVLIQQMFRRGDKVGSSLQFPIAEPMLVLATTL
jgi:hypothetical protein